MSKVVELPTERDKLSEASVETIDTLTMDDVEKQTADCLSRLSKESEEAFCYPLLLPGSLDAEVVDDVYADLKSKCSGMGVSKLLVVVDSPGGDIHAAFNLAQLFRRYGRESLVFVVPRWAKSAATLLVFGGDKILLTPVAELGPIDPQITEFNPLEKRLEQFSPLHIENTLKLIRDEYNNGNSQLADGLIQRLQFPLTLGSFKTSLEVGKDYLRRLLSSRMLRDHPDDEVGRIAEKMTEGYHDHGFCIQCGELKDMGIVAEELEGDALDIVWEIHLLNRRRQRLDAEALRDDIDKRIRNLPPELLKQLGEIIEPDQAGARRA